jgi:hypothetical protein
MDGFFCCNSECGDIHVVTCPECPKKKTYPFQKFEDINENHALLEHVSDMN